MSKIRCMLCPEGREGPSTRELDSWYQRHFAEAHGDNARHPNPHAYVDTETAAHAAGITPATIRGWARDGWLTKYGSPRHRLWDLQEIYQARTDHPRNDNGS